MYQAQPVVLLRLNMMHFMMILVALNGLLVLLEKRALILNLEIAVALRGVILLIVLMGYS